MAWGKSSVSVRGMWPEGWFAREDGPFRCTLSRSWSLAVRDGFAGVLATVPQRFRCCSEPLTLIGHPVGMTSVADWPVRSEVASLSYPIHTVHRHSASVTFYPAWHNPCHLRLGLRTRRGVEPRSVVDRCSVRRQPVGFPSRPVCYPLRPGSTGCFRACNAARRPRQSPFTWALTLRCLSPQRGDRSRLSTR